MKTRAGNDSMLLNLCILIATVLCSTFYISIRLYTLLHVSDYTYIYMNKYCAFMLAYYAETHKHIRKIYLL